MLADLASGSVGEAMALLRLDGLAMYRDICGLMRTAGAADSIANWTHLGTNCPATARMRLLICSSALCNVRSATGSLQPPETVRHRKSAANLDRYGREKVRILLAQAGGLGAKP